MADDDKNDNADRPRRRQAPRPARSDDRPFAKRERDDRPRSARKNDEDRPVRQRRQDGDRPSFRPRERGDERPFGKPRRDGDRPPFRKPGDKPARRTGGSRDERPFGKPRRDGERPSFRKHGDKPARRTDRSPDEGPRRSPEGAGLVLAAEPAEERIAKVIARAGVASRRDAEAMIAEGRVTLNGDVLASPAVNVKPTDQITVDGEPLPARERTRLWIFHKPRGLVTTARDPQGRPTVFESLPEEMPRVVAVGRLDINTEGLLLLTNDGGLARVIAHPETGWLRRYKVRAHGDITQEQLDRLRDGITIDEVEYGPIEARLDRIQGDNVWLTMGLREGKNREIKTILEHLGLQVNRLLRLSFGPFQLGDLEAGLVEEVRTKVLREQLGQKLAEEAGVDFESPVREPIAPFGSPNKAPRRDGDRPERDSRGPARREDHAPHGRGGREFPSRSRDERPPRGRRDEEAAPRPRRQEDEPRRSVWRADDADKPRRTVAPRRGADPKEARAASGERQHERVGAIAAPRGRKVVVERLVAEPKPERSPAAPKRSPEQRAPSGDDRPRRRDRDSADRPRSFDERKGAFGKGGFGKGGFHKGGGRDGFGKGPGGPGRGPGGFGKKPGGPGRGRGGFGAGKGSGPKRPPRGRS